MLWPRGRGHRHGASAGWRCHALSARSQGYHADVRAHPGLPSGHTYDDMQDKRLELVAIALPPQTLAAHVPPKPPSVLQAWP